MKKKEHFVKKDVYFSKKMVINLTNKFFKKVK